MKSHLVEREKRIVELLKEGKTTAQIADSLCVSKSVVSNTLTNIFIDNDVNNRTGLLGKIFGKKRNS